MIQISIQMCTMAIQLCSLHDQLPCLSMHTGRASVPWDLPKENYSNPSPLFFMVCTLGLMCLVSITLVGTSRPAPPSNYS